MRVVSIDKTPDGFAVKLDQNAKVSPEKLMEKVTESGAVFTPNGVLRVKSTEDLLENVHGLLTAIKTD